MSDTVFELDGLCDDFDPWAELCDLKARYPKLRVTLFAIPGRCSDELLARYRAVDWVELGVHGYYGATVECATWSYDFTREVLEELQEAGWTKLIKPIAYLGNAEFYDAVQDSGWTTSDDIVQSQHWGDSDVKRYVFNACPGVDAVRAIYAINVEHQKAEFKFVSEVVGPSPVRSYIWSVLDEMQLEAGEYFLDCGAYKGEEIEVLFPMGVEVRSYEAHPKFARELAQRWDGVAGVDIRAQAVAAKAGTVQLAESGLFDCGSSIVDTKVGMTDTTYDVEAVRLADVVRERVPKVLKLDVEGVEWEILDDLLNEGLLDKIEHIYVEDHVNRIQDEKVHALKVSVLERCQKLGIGLKPWI